MLAGTPYVRARASYYDIHTEFQVPRTAQVWGFGYGIWDAHTHIWTPGGGGLEGRAAPPRRCQDAAIAALASSGASERQAPDRGGLAELCRSYPHARGLRAVWWPSAPLAYG